MFILEGQAEVVLWVPRAVGEDTGDTTPMAWSDDRVVPEALCTAGSQASCFQPPSRICSATAALHMLSDDSNYCILQLVLCA